MKVAVYGLGYVGAVTVACLADLGHEVVGVDTAPTKVAELLAGRAPVVEPGLDELLARHIESGRISATADGIAAASDVDVVMLAVGTPSTPAGGVDARFLLAVADDVGAGLQQNPRDFVPVLSRSTSLPEFHEAVADRLVASSGRQLGDGVGYACHPEFLRETTAILDFYDPPVVVFGSEEEATFVVCRNLYPGIDAEVLEVGVGEAALVKYAANAYHALKVTFANEIGLVANALDVDSRQVMEIFCKDDKLNISEKYLRPGNPFGGSCLPKDVRAILDFARREALTLPLLNGTLASNRAQLDVLVDNIIRERPASVAIVGLSFKEGTDDLREAPMVAVAERLIGKGVALAIFDPGLVVEALVGANARFALEALPHLAELVAADIEAVTSGADVIVVNHRVSQREWDAIHLRPDATVIDLVSIPALESHPGYHGLYWSAS